MASFSGVVTFVLFCFVFVFLMLFSLKPRPFIQSPFDMQATRWPHSHVFLSSIRLLFGNHVAFSEYFFVPSFIAVFSLYGEYVVPYVLSSRMVLKEKSEHI